MLVAQGMTLAVYDLCVPSRSSYSYQCNPGGMCLGKPGSQCRERHVIMQHSLAAWGWVRLLVQQKLPWANQNL